MEREVPKGVQASRQLNIDKGYIYFELETSHSIYIYMCKAQQESPVFGAGKQIFQNRL